jgi:flagellar hook-basal body complex protein FliE
MDPIIIQDSRIFEIPRQNKLPPAETGETFGEVFKKAWSDVQQVQDDKDLSVRNLVETRGPDIHNTMIDIQKAEISFKLMMQVRNKIVSAYEEVMRMNV